MIEMQHLLMNLLFSLIIHRYSVICKETFDLEKICLIARLVAQETLFKNIKGAVALISWKSGDKMKFIKFEKVKSKAIFFSFFQIKQILIWILKILSNKFISNSESK